MGRRRVSLQKLFEKSRYQMMAGERRQSTKQPWVTSRSLISFVIVSLQRPSRFFNQKSFQFVRRVTDTVFLLIENNTTLTHYQ